MVRLMAWLLTNAAFIAGLVIVADNWLQIVGFVLILWSHNMDYHANW